MLSRIGNNSTIQFRQKACPPLRALFRWVTPCLFLGSLCLFALISPPASAQDDLKIIITPEPGEGVEIRRMSETQVQLLIRSERDLLRPQGTIGDVDVGELSPLNTAN